MSCVATAVVSGNVGKETTGIAGLISRLASIHLGITPVMFESASRLDKLATRRLGLLASSIRSVQGGQKKQTRPCT
jgi:hypothetical protein